MDWHEEKLETKKEHRHAHILEATAVVSHGMTRV